MVTDPVPQRLAARRQYEASDAIVELALPPAEPLQAAARALKDALGLEDRTQVKKAGSVLLAQLAGFYGTSQPDLAVLGVRPHRVIEGRLAYELFGDYTFESERIRLWMRTAIRGQLTSYRGLLNTLLHEFCHHLDVKTLGLPETPHTRGFFSRVDGLYHLALDTPPDKRKPLVWLKTGRRWRIDWTQLR